jgi:hypothetical protein
MKEIKFVYIASPYTIGDQPVNVRNSLKVADELITLGYVPFAPLLSHFQHMFFSRAWKEWVELDKEWILKCDAIVRILGESVGADIEVEYASEHNIPVFYSIEELVKYCYE